MAHGPSLHDSRTLCNGRQTHVLRPPGGDPAVRPWMTLRVREVGMSGFDGRTVLVVDDEPDVRALVSAALAADGWVVAEAGNQEEAMAAVRARHPSAIVLDIGLGRESGYDVCRAVREVGAIPILFLTARQTEFDQVLAFELGADDYLGKPFSPRLLRARIAAIVRRAEERGTGTTGPADVHTWGRLVVDERSRRARVDDTELPLTKIEFDLLAVLVRAPERAFERDLLLDRVWGEWYSDAHVVDVTMGRLRHKLGAAGAEGIIETVRGVGYRLAALPDPGSGPVR